MNNPKIKVEADLNLSAAESEIASFRQELQDLKRELDSSTGKSRFENEFQAAGNELSKMLRRYDELQKKLDAAEKSGKRYANALKEASDLTRDAANLASKLEDLGSLKNTSRSGYFLDESSAHRDEQRRVLDQMRQEAAQARQDAQRDANISRFGNHAMRFAGAVGGMAMGGGGAYANMGSLAGSVFGGVGSIIGGMVGSAVDRYMAPARDEARLYSELRRMLGSTVTDFGYLRGAVRAAVDGLGIADTEAANLAKQFAKTAGLAEDTGTAVARGVHTAGGFAHGYGISPETATSFFANMRALGGANNDKDARRLAMLIGESVGRGGTSAKMDEVLSVIANWTAHAARATLLAPNVGQYASYLASMTGSNYAGLRGNPGGAAQLLNIGEAGVMSGGTMGEASKTHWLMARTSAFREMSPLDDELMRTAGLTGDLAALFGPGSAAYDRAKSTGDMATVAHMDAMHRTIMSSGLRNNYEVGMAHIKAISGGNAMVENANFRGMFGGNQQQAAALMQLLSNDAGLGKFEKQLARYGVTLDNLDVAQIASLSALMSGGGKAMATQYEKLLGTGKLSAEEVSHADAIMAKEGYGDSFKELLIKLTQKYDTDEGLESQKTQIQLSNEISRGVSNLIGIENDVRSLLMRIVRHISESDPIINSINSRNAEYAKVGLPASGKTKFGHGVNENFANEVDAALAEIGMASSPAEKERSADNLRRRMKLNPRAYPVETEQWLANALTAKGAPKTTFIPDSDSPTIPDSVPGANENKKNAPYMINKLMSLMPELTAEHVVGMIANVAYETGGFKKFHNMAGGGLGAHGLAHWRGSRLKAFDKYRNGRPIDDIDVGLEYIASELRGAENKALRNLLKTTTESEAAVVFFRDYERAGDNSGERRAEIARNYMQQIPQEYRNKKYRENRENRMNANVSGTFVLQDYLGRQVADPLHISTSFGPPVPAGS